MLQTESWTAKADENSTEEINLPSMRGVIYDRNGVVLAQNVASYNVVVTAAKLPDDEGAIQEIYRQLSKLIGVPVNQGEISLDDPYVPCISEHGIAQIAEYGRSSTPFQPVKVKCDVDRRVAMVIMEHSSDWPGIGIEIQPIREYPTGSLTANMIGFLGPVPAALEDYYVAKRTGAKPRQSRLCRSRAGVPGFAGRGKWAPGG